MKVGKALYNILGSSKEIQENFPFNTTDYAPSSTELVTNGDFNNGSANWTLGTGWSIGEDKAICDGTQTVQSNLFQTGIVPINKSYKAVFDIVVNAGGLVIGIGGSNEQPIISTSGTYTLYSKATSGDSNFYFAANSSFVGSVTNLSVKEMVLTKIFPEIAPTGINAPYIVYSVVSNQPSESKEDNGAIDTASVEVYSFQDTYNKAIDLGVDVRAALKRVNGTYNTIEIQSIDYTNEQMDVNEKRDLWASIQDYEIRIKN